MVSALLRILGRSDPALVLHFYTCLTMSTITGRVVRQMQSSQHVCVRSELKAFCRYSRMNLRAACYLLPVNLVSPFRC